MTYEKKVKEMIVSELDRLFDGLADFNFKELDDNEEELSEEDIFEVESIFMSYRNVIAGTEWDGERREYERYEVK